jgi:hypothetical protein
MRSSGITTKKCLSITAGRTVQQLHAVGGFDSMPVNNPLVEFPLHKKESFRPVKKWNCNWTSRRLLEREFTFATVDYRSVHCCSNKFKTSNGVNWFKRELMVPPEWLLGCRVWPLRRRPLLPVVMIEGIVAL